MRISHSRVELFNTCGAKYYYRYIDKLEADITSTPLLFGSSCDKAFNYLLLRQKRNKVVYADTAKAILLKEMSKWHGQNELVFFKNEAPEGIDELSKEDRQWAVWNHLVDVGYKMVDTYIVEILPLFERIIKVQSKQAIKNEAGDELILVIDFVAQLKDGRVVTFDNKTTTDVKKGYPASSVKKSQQLAIYSEFSENRTAGYLALQKKLKDGKVIWNIIVDEIPEEQVDTAFERVDQALRDIKDEKFDKNEKNCWQFNKRCEYWSYCKTGNPEGLKNK